jgi:hypothetical protein
MGEASSYKEYLAGLLAGVATVITGHPFDTVKVTTYIYIYIYLCLHKHKYMYLFFSMVQFGDSNVVIYGFYFCAC